MCCLQTTEHEQSPAIDESYTTKMGFLGAQDRAQLNRLCSQTRKAPTAKRSGRAALLAIPADSSHLPHKSICVSLRLTVWWSWCVCVCVNVSQTLFHTSRCFSARTFVCVCVCVCVFVASIALTPLALDSLMPRFVGLSSQQWRRECHALNCAVLSQSVGG